MGRDKKLKKRSASSEPTKSQLSSDHEAKATVNSKSAQTNPSRKSNVHSGSNPVFRIEDPRDLRDSPSYIAQQRASQRLRAGETSRRMFTAPLLPDLDSVYKKFNASDAPNQNKDSKRKPEPQGEVQSNKSSNVRDLTKSNEAFAASTPTKDEQGQHKSPAKSNPVQDTSDGEKTSKATDRKQRTRSRKPKATHHDGEGDIKMADAAGIKATGEGSLIKPAALANDKSHKASGGEPSIRHDRDSEKQHKKPRKDETKRKGSKNKRRESTVRPRAEEDGFSAKAKASARCKSKGVDRIGGEESSSSDNDGLSEVFSKPKPQGTIPISDTSNSSSNDHNNAGARERGTASSKSAKSATKKTKTKYKDKELNERPNNQDKETNNTDNDAEAVDAQKETEGKKAKPKKKRKRNKSKTKYHSLEDANAVAPESDTDSESSSHNSDSASASDRFHHRSPIRAMSATAEAEEPRETQPEIELSSDSDNDAGTESDTESDDNSSEDGEEKGGEQKPTYGQKRKLEGSSDVASSVASRNRFPALTEFPSFQRYLANSYKRQKKEKSESWSARGPGPCSGQIIYPKPLLAAADALEAILPDHEGILSQDMETTVRLTKLLEQSRSHLITLAANRIALNGGPSKEMQEQLTRIAKDREQEIHDLRRRMREREQTAARQVVQGKKGR